MSKQLYTISKEGLEYLCGLINKIVTLPSDVISDITLATNQTMSSVKIDKIIKQCLQDANEYSNEVVNSLTHLVAEKIDFEPTLDNTTDKINTLLLYSANSDNNYTQYLRLTNELLNLGDTSLSLNEYIKEVDADTKYTLKTTTDTLTTEITNIKSDFNTHKDDTDIHITADERTKWNNATNEEKVKEIVDSEMTTKGVCTTKVADVPWTKITPTTDFQGNIRYRVKNGFCYVKIDSLTSDNMTTIGQIVATGIPKPEQGIEADSDAWYSLGSKLNSASDSFQNLLVRVSGDGNIINYQGTDNTDYYGFFSYPVAES